ncbi:MAG: OsmC family protein [Thermoleophilia bacterium]|nr:OsmC family protein [Thermoleophilia bacterium]
MSPVKARTFEFVASLAPDGVVLAEGAEPVRAPESWLPEHWLLAGVALCSLKSLRFHARGATVEAAAGMRCTVTQRETDGRYAIVETAIDFDVTIEPAPEPEQLPGLLAKAERDCFVGNSLTAKPAYAWRVNGRAVGAAPAVG